MQQSQRMSRMLGRTLRQAPAEAETDNHKLLLRARLIEQLAAGVYSYLPLGWRVMRRIEQVIREEMDREGGLEVSLPALQPAELWEESGRYQTVDVLFKVHDRREREHVLGPTHEEVMVDIIRRNVQSYRDLPLLPYQIQTKFRDEQRPRGGLVRVREFTMKDLYSFDADWEGLDQSYDKMVAAYTRIFARCGVPTIPVQADSGAIGGKDSQEFLFLTDIGEDDVLLCPICGYAANAEKADFRKPPLADEAPRPLEKVSTPGTKTIEAVATLLGVPTATTLKAVFYEADGRPVFVAIRGDLEVNDVKLKNALHAVELKMAGDAAIQQTGGVAGFASPIGLSGVTVVADDSASGRNLVAGANEPDFHYVNSNYGRDWQAEIMTDIALARAGDGCAACGAPLEQRRGVEMGHVFKLGTVYTEKMGATYLDDEGKSHPMVMGCYGIGVGRLLAAVVEANHDDRGIIWPVELTPFDVHLVALNVERDDVRETADRIFVELQAAGLRVLYDDREETAGVKFNDADLLGMPWRLTISPRTLERDAVELKRRMVKEFESVSLGSAVAGTVAACRATAGEG
ncbi:MAG: proline--tRNA ligase [Dehalococcoidia bacterium]